MECGDDSLLIVDDVFDSGHSIEALLRELTAKMRRNMPGQVRIATPWYKPANNRTALKPDYYLHETDRWIRSEEHRLNFSHRT